MILFYQMTLKPRLADQLISYTEKHRLYKQIHRFLCMYCFVAWLGIFYLGSLPIITWICYASYWTFFRFFDDVMNLWLAGISSKTPFNRVRNRMVLFWNSTVCFLWTDYFSIKIEINLQEVKIKVGLSPICKCLSWKNYI